MNLNSGALLAHRPIMVRISDQTINDTLNLSATYRLRNTGVADIFTEAQGSFIAIPGEWLVSGVVGDYQVMWTKNSGTAPNVVGPAEGVWGSFTLQLNLTSGATGNFTVRIRHAITLEVLDTAIISLTA